MRLYGVQAAYLHSVLDDNVVLQLWNRANYEVNGDLPCSASQNWSTCMQLMLFKAWRVTQRQRKDHKWTNSQLNYQLYTTELSTLPTPAAAVQMI